MEYLIIESDSAENLQKSVNKWLEKGYSLQGGVNVYTIYVPAQRQYAQAIFKPKGQNDE